MCQSLNYLWNISRLRLWHSLSYQLYWRASLIISVKCLASSFKHVISYWIRRATLSIKVLPTHDYFSLLRFKLYLKQLMSNFVHFSFIFLYLNYNHVLRTRIDWRFGGNSKHYCDQHLFEIWTFYRIWTVIKMNTNQ